MMRMSDCGLNLRPIYRKRPFIKRFISHPMACGSGPSNEKDRCDLEVRGAYGAPHDQSFSPAGQAVFHFLGGYSSNSQIVGPSVASVMFSRIRWAMIGGNAMSSVAPG